MKSWSKPTPEQVANGWKKLGNASAVDYFFSRLNNPNWIELLDANGAFDTPPEPIRSSDGTRSPAWPQSRYLARVASEASAHDPIVRIISKTNTENFSVAVDMMNATVHLPAIQIVTVLPKIRLWIDKLGAQWIQPYVTKIVGVLVQSDFKKEAIGLVKKLTAIRRGQGESSREEAFETSLDAWHYRSLLDAINNPLSTSSVGSEWFELLCSTLAAAVKFSSSDHAQGVHADYSYIWRPAIEDHEQNFRSGIRDVLVSAVRDSAVAIVAADATSLKDLLPKLVKYPWPVFTRIALHLLASFPKAAIGEIQSRVENLQGLDNTNTRHELALLLKKSFDVLPTQTQGVILKWIDEGPDIDEFSALIRKVEGRSLSTEEAEQYKGYWQRDRLSWIEESLPLERKQRLEELNLEHGKSEHADFSAYHKEFVGPVAHVTAKELEESSVANALRVLATWVPEPGFGKPSVMGLAREFAQVVAKKPNEYAVVANKFRVLNPRYAEAFFDGLGDAIRNGMRFAWKAPLSLCLWAALQRDIHENEANEDEDSFRGMRLSIARLMRIAFSAKKGRIPWGLRKKAWSVLLVLTNDSDPSATEENHEAFDPSSRSINSTRGEAMHAVVQYALWVRDQTCKGKLSKKPGPGFQKIPEVREVLERHLDPNVDASLSIRSVYGHWFPWLRILDPKWTRANVSRIFPEGREATPFWEAAWQDYILYRPPYDDVLELLIPQYERALQQEYLESVTRNDERYVEHLVQHIVTYYLRGQLPLNVESSLINRLLNTGRDDLIGEAFHYIGWSFWKTESPVKPLLRERIMKLWDSRREQILEAAAKHQNELLAFGWLFASRQFPPGWALPRLLEVLRITRTADAEHLVAEYLEELAKDHIGSCLEAIETGFIPQIATGNEYEWEDKPMKILKLALESKDPKISGKATTLINKIVGAGKPQYMELVSNQTTAVPIRARLS